MVDTADILRHQARDGNVFDKSNDTVVVTRTLLTTAADEIEALRASLRATIPAVRSCMADDNPILVEVERLAK